MKIDSSEISALIKAQIKGYEGQLETDDVGTVISVGDGIALCYGLDKAMLGELLVFPHDVYGMANAIASRDRAADFINGKDPNVDVDRARAALNHALTQIDAKSLAEGGRKS